MTRTLTFMFRDDIACHIDQEDTMNAGFRQIVLQNLLNTFNVFLIKYVCQ